MRDSARGISLVEVMIVMSLALLIGSAALTLTLSGRSLYQTDRARTTVNQNLRAGLDIVGINIRQAGESLPMDFPAIEVVEGAAGAPDTLVLRRNLVGTVLRVCQDIFGGTTNEDVFIADTSSPPPGCVVAPDLNMDGWPDNLESWRGYRLASGGEVRAYVYNPVTRAGEFFRYDAEDNLSYNIEKADLQTWQNDYLVASNARIYLLEERRYTLSGSRLRFIENADAANPVDLIDRVTDFQVGVRLQNGATPAGLGPADDWTAVESLGISLNGRMAARNRFVARSVSSRFAPRNVISN